MFSRVWQSTMNAPRSLSLPRTAAEGVPVSVTDKDRVRVSGYLRDSAYSESLREFLRKAQKIDRIADGDDDVRVGRVPTYVVVRSLVRFTPRRISPQTRPPGRGEPDSGG